MNDGTRRYVQQNMAQAPDNAQPPSIRRGRIVKPGGVEGHASAPLSAHAQGRNERRNDAMKAIEMIRRKPALVVRAKPPRPADLGPNQIEWLRKHVANFEFCKAAADAAAEHTRQARAKMEGAR